MTLLTASLKGTSYLIALQASSRILTFVLNQLILQYTNPAVFGFATIQLELLLNTILFLCREGFRITVQRLPAPSPDDKTVHDRSQEVVNISCIPVLLGLLLSTAIASLYILKAPTESAQIPYFRQSVILYALSTIFELLAEPGYNIALYKLLYRIRAGCEGSAVIVRCVIAFTVSLLGGPNLGALSFAIGQLGYSITLLILYFWSTSGIASWRPKVLDSSGSPVWMDASALYLSVLNTLQSLLKHILTEGDKLMISYFCSNEEQGKYGLTANYGGLIARIVFQPVEEATRSFFSNLLPQQGTSKPTTTSKRHEKYIQARLVLSTILRGYILISLLIAAVAPSVIDNILPLLLSKTWSSITPVLALYMYYIPLLAINGVLEAFITASASPTLLRQQGLMWIFFSIMFGFFGFLGRNRGAEGLVYANCGNLALRIVWAGFYTRKILSEGEDYAWVSESMPSFISISSILGLACALRTITTNSTPLSYLTNLFGLGLLSITVIVYGEYDWIKERYKLLSNLK